MLRVAQASGVGTFVQGGVDPQDWIRQRAIQKQLQQSLGIKVALCFGLHPYFVARSTESECEEAYALLGEALAHVVALGEVGLDFRPKWLSPSPPQHASEAPTQMSLEEIRERQIDWMIRQLELAEVFRLPVVLHLVQAEDEAQKILALHSVARGGMVHSFAGTSSQMMFFLRETNLHLSFGGSALHPRRGQRIRQGISSLSSGDRSLLWERFCLESDTPDQPAPGESQSNPRLILEVAKSLAPSFAVTEGELLDKASQNARELFAI